MNGEPQREMTLQEWVERLLPAHSARREYENLLAEIEAAREWLTAWQVSDVGEKFRAYRAIVEKNS